MADQDAHFRSLQIRLESLRPLLAGSKGAQEYLGLFDELIRECEFGSALAILCEFFLQAPSLVDDHVIEQIEQLHGLMKVKGTCLEKLRALGRPK